MLDPGLLEEIFLSSPIAICVVDMRCVVSAANPAFMKLFRIPPEMEYAGKVNLLEVKSIREAGFDKYLLQLLAGESLSLYERKFITEYTREELYLNIKGVPLVRAGRREGGLILIEDVTMRKQLQLQLAHSEKLAGIGTLASGIAHEFNNLLSGMLGNTQLALTMQPEDKEVIECLCEIEKLCFKARDLVNNILTFSVRSKPDLAMRRVVDLIERTIRLVEKEWKATNVEIKRDYRKDPELLLDSGQMQQVFLNLALNAYHAMLPEGGTLTITVDDSPDEVIIEFKDTGKGIPIEIREKIFEPFFTTKGSRSGSTIPGTGLGLPVSLGIVENHGGKIEVESETGRGTTVRIILPCNKTSQSKEVETFPCRIEKGPIIGLRILAVDDEELILSFFRRLAKYHDIVLFEARCGEEAIERVKEGGVDIVFLDCSLPGIGGIETYRQLQLVEQKPAVVLMTGFSPDEYIPPDILEYSPVILRKPFQIQELFSSIRKVLG